MQTLRMRESFAIIMQHCYELASGGLSVYLYIAGFQKTVASTPKFSNTIYVIS